MEYRLDLNTLLLMLRQSTGSLYSEVQHLPGVRGRCQVFLRLERGLIKTCSVKNEYDEEVVSGEAAVKLIERHVLEWTYKEEQALPRALQETSPRLPQLSLPPQQPVSIPRSAIPFRAHPIPQNEFLTWPRLYRSIYSLIDGKTSIDDIVRLLAREQGAERVLGVITRFQQENLIVLKGEHTGEM